MGTNRTPQTAGTSASALGVISRGTDGVVHQFTPIVSVTLRDDGRYDLDVDWGSSYFGSYDAANDDVSEGAESVLQAIAAMDVWSASPIVRSGIIPPAKEAS